MKKKKSTADLMESLTQSHDLQLFMDENESDFQREDIADYLQALLKEKHLKKSRVIQDAMLNEVYGYQIFSGAKTPRRDKVLCLALAMGLTLEETQKMLRACGFSPLYVRHRRDCVFIHSILEKKSVMEVNAVLDEMGLPLCV